MVSVGEDTPSGALVQNRDAVETVERLGGRAVVALSGAHGGGVTRM
jgi:hypothetical protein